MNKIFPNAGINREDEISERTKQILDSSKSWAEVQSKLDAINKQPLTELQELTDRLLKPIEAQVEEIVKLKQQLQADTINKLGIYVKVVWLKASSTGRPNDQRFKILQFDPQSGRFNAESCGNGDILVVHWNDICALEFDGRKFRV